MGPNNKVIYCLHLDFHLVAARTKCNGTALEECRRSSASECAEGCRGVSSMFSFGRQDSAECNERGVCSCLCLLEAVNGSCTQRSSNSTDLFRYMTSMGSAFLINEPEKETPSKCFHKSIFKY